MNGTEQRVGKLAAGDLAVLAEFRARSGWMLHDAGDGSYWLRMPAADEADFRRLPLLGRWSSGAKGQLTRDGRRVPEQILPQDGWQPLASLLPIAAPPRGAPGMAPPAISFSLEADTGEFPAEALLATLDSFALWSEEALVQRLSPLRFACCQDRRVFVTGTPLPPIRGRGFYRIGRLWIPCGYRLPEQIWPGLLEEHVRLAASRFALLHTDGSYESMDEENLIPASRPAVRATATGMPPV